MHVPVVKVYFMIYISTDVLVLITFLKMYTTGITQYCQQVI